MEILVWNIKHLQHQVSKISACDKWNLSWVISSFLRFQFVSTIFTFYFYKYLILLMPRLRFRSVLWLEVRCSPRKSRKRKFLWSISVAPLDLGLKVNFWRILNWSTPVVVVVVIQQFFPFYIHLTIHPSIGLFIQPSILILLSQCIYTIHPYIHLSILTIQLKISSPPPPLDLVKYQILRERTGYREDNWLEFFSTFTERGHSFRLSGGGDSPNL